MIDLHCHILPGLDDGAVDLADSLALARGAAADGVEAVCATPHIRCDHDVVVAELPARIAALQGALDAAGIGVRILPGGEVAEERIDQLTASELRALSLGGGGRWVLVEPAPGPLSAQLAHHARRLRAEGLGTVVAHPERHADADFEARLRALADAGCLIQWTADFIATSESGLPLRLAAEGLVHVLGSDAHSSHAGRAIALTPALARLADACGPDQLAWIAEQAPRAIVAGAQLQAPW